MPDCQLLEMYMSIIQRMTLNIWQITLCGDLSSTLLAQDGSGSLLRSYRWGFLLASSTPYTSEITLADTHTE